MDSGGAFLSIETARHWSKLSESAKLTQRLLIKHKPWLAGGRGGGEARHVKWNFTLGEEPNRTISSYITQKNQVRMRGGWPNWSVNSMEKSATKKLMLKWAIFLLYYPKQLQMLPVPTKGQLFYSAIFEVYFLVGSRGSGELYTDLVEKNPTMLTLIRSV